MHYLLTAFIWGLVVVGLIGCQSVKKTTPARHTSSDKLTRDAEDSDEQLHIGIEVTVDLPPTDGRVAYIQQSFDDQIVLFEPCRTVTKDGLFMVEATWRIAKNGRLRALGITQLVPDTAELNDCFLKQIRQLRPLRTARGVSGSLVLQTYYGSKRGSKDYGGRQE